MKNRRKWKVKDFFKGNMESNLYDLVKNIEQ